MRKRKNKSKPKDMSENGNPFLSGYTVPIKIVEKVVVLDDVSQAEIDSGTVVGFRGDSVSNTKRIIIELEEQVSLQLTYMGEDKRDTFEMLSNGAKDMFLYISFNIGKNKTLYYLDRVYYMDRYGIKSHTTFIAHRNDLIEAGIISLSFKTNWIWINPRYIFNGIRSQFFKEYCKVEDVIKLKG